MSLMLRVTLNVDFTFREVTRITYPRTEQDESVAETR